MEKREAPEKIVLPQNLQREMLKFFLKYSAPKMNANKEQQSLDSNKELEREQ